MEQHVKHLSTPENRLHTACGENWQGWQAPTDPDMDVIIDKPMNPPRLDDTVIPCEACKEAGGVELEYYG